ncbi:MAG TPA: translocation/assembly module TamB, partial [Salinimicrobium sp.]|nr:translocation/assembly module TamB [Salinimicrobium sp.]
MKDEKKTKKKSFRALRIIGKILLGLVIFVVLLLLFIRSPWGQNIIVGELIASVEKKTGAQVDVEDVYISFSGDININGLYIEDLSGDTLLYSKSLEADIPLWPIIKGNGISINSVRWQGVVANVMRQDSISGFNYQFLLNAYAPADTIAKPKDTSATNFDLGELHFRNFDLAYHDAVLGTNADLHMGEFNLEMEKFSLEKGIFKVADANLANTEIKYIQTKPFPESEDTTAGAPPIVGIDNLTLDNVKAVYKSGPDKTVAKAAIDEFLLEMPMANLAEKKLIVETVLLKGSEILVKMDASEGKGAEKKEERGESKDKRAIASEDGQQAFEWPDWLVEVDDISLENNRITYLVNGQEPQQGNLNPKAIAINNLNLQLNSIYLKDRAAGANLEKLSFSGASGINFKNLSFEAKLNSGNFRLNNLALHINENILTGELELEYDSINALFEHPENVLVRADLPELQLSVDDAFLFQPDLRQNEYLKALAAHNIIGYLQINGTMGNLQIPQLHLNWGANTAITATGNVQNLTEPENIQFDFPQLDAVSTRRDLINFVEEDSLPIAIPKEIRLSSSFQGSPDNITATASVIIPEGKINLSGNFLNREKIAF